MLERSGRQSLARALHPPAAARTLERKLTTKRNIIRSTKGASQILAEREGFEPSKGVSPYSFSREAPSVARRTFVAHILEIIEKTFYVVTNCNRPPHSFVGSSTISVVRIPDYAADGFTLIVLLLEKLNLWALSRHNSPQNE